MKKLLIFIGIYGIVFTFLCLISPIGVSADLCGDGVCDWFSEDQEVCPEDCVICGDFMCTEGYENYSNCPEDCYCGDTVCEELFEDDVSCPEDCAVCGDGICTGFPYEDGDSCPEDCQICGNFYIEGTEECDDGNTENGDGCSDNCLIENIPPVAMCQDIIVDADSNCSANADIDDGSYDPDGDPITLEQAPSGPYLLGDTEVTLTVTDPYGASDSCTGIVTVVDTQAPSVDVTVAPTELWPPNHKMVAVNVTVTPTDNCGSDSALSCNIISVTSNEPSNGIGDGDTDVDIKIIGPSTLKLRAERAGSGSGRIYTITAECVDSSGNTAIGTAEVNVPHSKIDGIVSGTIQEGISVGLYEMNCGESLLVGTAITDSDGYYLFDLQPGNGFYSVIPENDICIFDPEEVGVKIPQETDFGPYDFTVTDSSE